MTTEDNLTRRTALKTMAAGAAGVALAGCSSSDGAGDGGSDDGGSGGNDDGSDDGGSDESGGNGGDSSGGNGGDNSGEDGGDSSGGSGSTDFDGWFDDVSNYDGVTDETGSDEITVEVGTQGNGGNFAFSPAAVRVSTGTTVVWEWTGQGSFHNVVAENGDFESEQTQEEGFTFEYTFDSAGTYEYVCVPHEAMGMKGAIVVE